MRLLLALLKCLQRICKFLVAYEKFVSLIVFLSLFPELVTCVQGKIYKIFLKSSFSAMSLKS